MSDGEDNFKITVFMRQVLFNQISDECLSVANFPKQKFLIKKDCHFFENIARQAFFARKYLLTKICWLTKNHLVLEHCSIYKLSGVHFSLFAHISEMKCASSLLSASGFEPKQNQWKTAKIPSFSSASRKRNTPLICLNMRFIAKYLLSDTPKPPSLTLYHISPN